MTDFETDGEGANRDDLLQRIELMETMIAEGRGFTTRNAWIFVLWGLVNLTGWSWQHFFRHSDFAGAWAWPICLIAGVVLTVAGKALQKRDQGYAKNSVCSRVMAVWGMMGLALGIYVASAMITHFTWQFSYVAALLMMIGMAHAISAVILRWRVQGLVAAIWWAGGAAIFFLNSWRATSDIMLAEMCLGMIAFGLYAMMLERNGGRSANRSA
jgi:hypothetical protein